MMWVWLKSGSIGMFAGESLKTFCNASKDVLYEAMNREDWNWRSLHAGIAHKAAQALNSATTGTAFILDDSIKEHHGKKMPGISSHFDHTTGRKVMGQQVLTLGLHAMKALYPWTMSYSSARAKPKVSIAPLLMGAALLASVTTQPKTRPSRKWLERCLAGLCERASRQTI